MKPTSNKLIRFFNTKRVFAIAGSLAFVASAGAQPVYLDLKSRFDTDAFLESGGTALTPPLEETRERIDASTLPAAYADNAAFTSADGKASFMFGPLKASSLDALAMNGQTISVPAGNYSAVDFALLSAAGSFDNPFSTIRFRYADGSTSDQRLGPVQGWFNSPNQFDNVWQSYTDSSSVSNIISFHTHTDDEFQYLINESGNGNDNGTRFVDGNGFVQYLFTLPADVTNATLGVRVGNNFVVSLSGENLDPWTSTTEGWTVVANSMEIYGTDHHANGNLKLYEFPLAPFLTNGTGEIYLLFTDASPNDGWGPYIQNISVYTGTNRFFEQDLTRAVNTNNATVYAMFRTDGGQAEAPYLYENKASGPSNRKHRFADGGQNLTYKFDFPDNVEDAKVTIDMANNFIVGISGPLSLNRYAQAIPGAANENDYLIDAGNSAMPGNFRFADGTAYMVYQFDLPNDVTNAYAQVTVGNQFIIEIAPGTDGEFVKERDYVAETGNEITDNTNLGVQELNLASYLVNNPEKIVRIRLSDGVPSNGWGPYLTGIAITDAPGTGEQVWHTVLNSQEMFGVDDHNELNKGYYTVDLSTVLKTNNPSKVAYINFTDGSTGEGWGPGVFWMAAYSGTIDIKSDGPVFTGLKAVNAAPEGNFGVNVVRRQYDLDPSKSLQEIILPSVPATAGTKPYVLAATLLPGTPVSDVSLTASLTATGELRLSWPASATGYSLESTSNLSQWTAVGGTPQTAGDQLTLTVPTTGTANFYRLKK